MLPIASGGAAPKLPLLPSDFGHISLAAPCRLYKLRALCPGIVSPRIVPFHLLDVLILARSGV